jgi:hypothetical protein
LLSPIRVIEKRKKDVSSIDLGIVRKMTDQALTPCGVVKPTFQRGMLKN